MFNNGVLFMFAACTTATSGEEATLSCFGNTCLPHLSKFWLGGKHYDLLSRDDNSRSPSKYQVKLYDTNFDLMIKNFNFSDFNCEYTCVCGFKQYTHLLQIQDTELIYPPKVNARFLPHKKRQLYIDVSMTVFPLPECKLLIKEKVCSTKIIVLNRPVIDGLKLFEIAMQLMITVNKNTCEGNLTLVCTVRSHEYKTFVKRLNKCKENKRTPFYIYIIGLGFPLFITVVLALVVLKCLKNRCATAVDSLVQMSQQPLVSGSK